ncbi:DNA/RNA-binding domain of Phe-tRNA-synthetase-like protein [Pseudonocardia eucalypti]|uniref:phenylalanine--tRNA ligase beta subunit-related protein n=1 Tax=Pseudonocardia eucalypti TaxID=648755 RepID=UPI001609C8EB|nr:DNA/RNA-binding domain of Phe-tRNA-synthetase-like protein [Pseudonocardia eucalypti]
MYFQHADEVWRDFPQLVPVALLAERITGDPRPEEIIERFEQRASARLATTPAGQLPEIQAWRRVFTRMGLKPTQYRCASESLLRRFAKEGSLPRIHPLVDLCNAVSLAYAVPVAAFDLAAVTDHLEVRYAVGDETYVTFGETAERPGAGEVIFADGAGYAHARRWSNRQSGRSAIRAGTGRALIVAEGLHPSAADDLADLTSELADSLTKIWSIDPPTTVLSRTAPRFDF